MSLRGGSRFRARPIDITRSLTVHYGEAATQHESQYDQEDYGRQLPQPNSGMLEQEELELALSADAAAGNGGSARTISVTIPTINPTNIPIPKFSEVKDYNVPGTFRRPPSYIRSKAAIDQFESDEVEYDLTSDDERFLEELNKQGHHISFDAFEVCIDRLEKENARLRQIEDQGAILASPGCMVLSNQDTHKRSPAANLRPAELKQIYDYWVEKRKRGKALLRRFIDPPDMHDPDPKVAFRPRHKNFTRSRRRNDVASFWRLKELRGGLERLQMILELIKRRERLKEEATVHQRAIFLSNLERLNKKLLLRRTDPSATLGSLQGQLSDDSDSSHGSVVDIQEDVPPPSPRFLPSSTQQPKKKRKIIHQTRTVVTPPPPPKPAPHTMLARIGRGGRVLLNRRVLPPDHILLSGVTSPPLHHSHQHVNPQYWSTTPNNHHHDTQPSNTFEAPPFRGRRRQLHGGRLCMRPLLQNRRQPPPPRTPNSSAAVPASPLVSRPHFAPPPLDEPHMPLVVGSEDANGRKSEGKKKTGKLEETASLLNHTVNGTMPSRHEVLGHGAKLLTKRNGFT